MLNRNPERKFKSQILGLKASVGALPLFLRNAGWVLVLAFSAISLQAHKPSDSYLFLKIEGSRVQGQWDMALRDLDHALADSEKILA